MSAKAKTPRVRVYTRLTATLRDRLAGYCDASGVAQCAVFETALEHYLNGTNDMTLVLRRLDRLGRAGARVHRDVELLSEAFAVFVQLWFAHTPSVPAHAKADARATAESRYKQFVQHITHQFSGGRRFLDDLPRELLASEAELDALAVDTGSPRRSP
jgi:hypothetical protein